MAENNTDGDTIGVMALRIPGDVAGLTLSDGLAHLVSLYVIATELITYVGQVRSEQRTPGVFTGLGESGGKAGHASGRKCEQD